MTARLTSIIGVLVVVSCIPAAAFSQVAQGSPPVLVFRDGNASKALPLAKVDTEVRIFGYLAETRTTMTFHNPHGRVLEGELQFPLPQGATISGYALDIQGRLIDGVVVAKSKAREVFEKEVRKGIDPGIVEWVKGNSFKTRVFPIPAGGERTIRVDYVSDLVATRDGPAYLLPMKYKNKVGAFRLRVEVVQGDAQPIVREGGLANFKFDKWRKGFAAEIEKKDVALTEDLAIVLPDVARQAVLVERAPDGTVYFCVNDHPAEPPMGPRAKQDPPKLLTVLWDASGSRGGSDHARELALLGKLLGQYKAATVAVDLVIIRDKAAPPRRFDITNGDAAALVEAIKALAYDGGTQLAAIAPAAGSPRPDFYLLFTDGISNFGHEDPAEMGAPVYAINADATASHSFLRYLAMKTGGVYYNLARMEDATVLNGIGMAAFEFQSVASAGGKVAETYPSMVEPVAGRFALAGKLVGDEATLTINYGDGGSTRTKSKFTVRKADAVEGNILRRFWAQKKVAELSVFPTRNAQAITDVGKAYSIVTPGTSLIVLDSIEQYLEHRIAPPKSLPEMYAEYQKRMDTVEMQQKKAKADKMTTVLAMWKERTDWWEKEFKYPKDFKYREKGKGGGLLRALGRAIGVGEATESGASNSASPATTLPPAAGEGRGGGSGLFDSDGGGGSGNSAFIPEAKKADGSPGRVGQPGVLIKPWDPKTPYLEAIRKAPAERRFDVYMTQRGKYAASPAFFADCAEAFRQAGQEALAVQVLSNIAEMELESAPLLRVLAHTLAKWGELELATGLFEKALEFRGEEPQSYRDLALVLAARGQYARAIELLNKVVMGRWDDRFEKVEGIALMEINQLLPKAKAAGADIKKLGLDARLVSLLACDVRIVLSWDADSTDIDLWVTEPSGEKVFYEHNRSTIGGRMSDDFTRGYGPEEYCLKKAMNGVYKIQADYYGSSAARLQGPVTLQIDIFTNFGRDNEQHKSITRRLGQEKETIQVGEIEY